MSRLRFSKYPLAVIGLIAAPIFAAEVAPCDTIQWQPNRVYVLKARLHHAIHIVLPEPMSGKPVWGNPDLWTVDGQSTHLFVKPTNKDSEEGASTSITVVGQSNTSYDFEVRRVPGGADKCVYVKKDGTLISSDSDWRTSEERRAAQMQSQLRTLQDQLSESQQAADRKALDALHEYRGRVFTGYKWGKGKGFLGAQVVAHVWDDGRFTFIRVNNDNKGLMQVTASVDGKDELVEYDYDSNKKLYTLAGLYPALTLHYGDSKITINREDDAKG